MEFKRELAAIIEEHRDVLPAASFAFLQRVYSGCLTRYQARLHQYGFTGLSNVLDAGCGFGQWSLTLASMNKAVHAIDGDNARVLFLQKVADRCALDNLTVRAGTLETLPYSTGSFDGVFCYGVIMCTAWKDSLRELTRVLRAGGRLYLNANGFGWYKFLWYSEHNKGPGYDPREHVAKAMLATARYQRGLPVDPGIDKLIEPEEIVAVLKSSGFEVADVVPEGHAGVAAGGTPAVAAFLPGEYRGDRGVYELLATRR